MGVFEDWQEGLATDVQALRALCSDLGEVESELVPLQEQREQLRAQIGEVVAHLGGDAEIAGFGRLTITSASVTYGYDKRRLDALIVELAADYPEVVARLAACRTQSMRAGGLRIEREKAGGKTNG
jgi:hypothetical protein